MEKAKRIPYGVSNFVDVVEQVSQLGLNGMLQETPKVTRNILSVMPTKAIRVHLWTELFLKATLMLFLKVCL